MSSAVLIGRGNLRNSRFPCPKREFLGQVAAFSWQLPLGGHGSRLALGTHPFYSFALRAKKRSDQETWEDHVLMPDRGETTLIWGHCV